MLPLNWIIAHAVEFYAQDKYNSCSMGAQRTLKTMETTLKKYKVYNNTSFQNKIKKSFSFCFSTTSTFTS